jgi:hypothetical protein
LVKIINKRKFWSNSEMLEKKITWSGLMSPFSSTLEKGGLRGIEVLLVATA